MCVWVCVCPLPPPVIPPLEGRIPNLALDRTLKDRYNLSPVLPAAMSGDAVESTLTLLVVFL